MAKEKSLKLKYSRRNYNCVYLSDSYYPGKIYTEPH